MSSTDQGYKNGGNRIEEEDHRASIKAYPMIPKYNNGDTVYLDVAGENSLRGPYTIESVTSEGKYTLADEYGNSVENGAEFEEKDLKRFG